MSDGTQLNQGVSGDLIRDIDRSLNVSPINQKTQIAQLDVGGEGVESLVTINNPVPVSDLIAAQFLRPILIELRIMNQFLKDAAGRNFRDDLDSMRSDEDQDLRLTQGL